MSRLIAISLILLAVLWAGFDFLMFSDNSLGEEISTLQQQIDGLSKQTETLRSRIANIEIQYLQDYPGSAVINLAGTGYTAIDTLQGKLLISPSGAESYLDGHRIKLRIGNPGMITYSGFTLTAQWGPRPPDFLKPDFTDPDEASEWRNDYSNWTKITSAKRHEIYREDQTGLMELDRVRPLAFRAL